MKKGLKFTKSQLQHLYVNKKLSANKMGQKFGCDSTNILYWLKKFNIERRPPNYYIVNIPREVLTDLYWNKNLKTQKIAEMFGIKHGRTILKKIRKLGIPSKTVSQASTKKFKVPFNNSPEEKAFLLGLRAGDFHAKKIHNCVRVQTSTAHSAQVTLMAKSFSKYGQICKYLSKNKSRETEWFIYADLDKSFSFMLNKPVEIPNWILNNDKLFLQFLAAYADCESCWKILKSHEDCVRIIFSIASSDLNILKGIYEKMKILGYTPRVYLKDKKGTKHKDAFGYYTNDFYELVLYKRSEISDLISNLLPISKHSEKISKMEFILKHIGLKWGQIQNPLLLLKAEISSELLKNKLNK